MCLSFLTSCILFQSLSEFASLICIPLSSLKKHSEKFPWAAREMLFDCAHYLLRSIIGFHDPSNLQNSISRNRNKKDTRKTLILPWVVSWETTEGELCSSSQGSTYSSSGTAVSCSCVCFSLLSSLRLSFPPCK